jgi:hypothetical protein
MGDYANRWTEENDSDGLIIVCLERGEDHVDDMPCGVVIEKVEETLEDEVFERKDIPEIERIRDEEEVEGEENDEGIFLFFGNERLEYLLQWVLTLEYNFEEN